MKFTKEEIELLDEIKYFRSFRMFFILLFFFLQLDENSTSNPIWFSLSIFLTLYLSYLLSSRMKVCIWIFSPSYSNNFRSNWTIETLENSKVFSIYKIFFVRNNFAIFFPSSKEFCVSTIKLPIKKICMEKSIVEFFIKYIVCASLYIQQINWAWNNYRQIVWFLVYKRVPALVCVYCIV